jgi:hypothetical protein
MGSQSELVTYVRKGRRIEVGILPDCCDYIFKVQGHQLETVAVGITGGWHEEIPSLSWNGTDKELIAIAKEFLKKELAKGWAPTAENNRLEIPNEQMEYRLRNGSFLD